MNSSTFSNASPESEMKHAIFYGFNLKVLNRCFRVFSPEFNERPSKTPSELPVYCGREIKLMSEEDTIDPRIHYIDKIYRLNMPIITVIKDQEQDKWFPVALYSDWHEILKPEEGGDTFLRAKERAQEIAGKKFCFMPEIKVVLQRNQIEDEVLEETTSQLSHLKI